MILIKKKFIKKVNIKFSKLINLVKFYIIQMIKNVIRISIKLLSFNLENKNYNILKVIKKLLKLTVLYEDINDL